jgi:hypothetical protein
LSHLIGCSVQVGFESIGALLSGHGNDDGQPQDNARDRVRASSGRGDSFFVSFERSTATRRHCLANVIAYIFETTRRNIGSSMKVRADSQLFFVIFAAPDRISLLFQTRNHRARSPSPAVQLSDAGILEPVVSVRFWNFSARKT